MDIGNKRHGKKSDKETQSPVLKVFKEMIQRENNDPEKANLLKEKQENRKRRQYSGSRSKSDRVNRSCDSSSSEKNRRSVQYKVAVHEQRLKDYNQSQSLPFQGDKKDSWWFWGDTQKKRSEDTCSCVSCALKKIVSSEYTCIACLGILFLISVLVAFLVLFRTVPIVAKNHHGVGAEKKRVGSDVLRKKIEAIQRGKEDGDYGSLWDDTMTRRLSGLTGLRGNDFDDGSYRELNTLEESGSELSGVLDAEKLNNGLSSERLRNFYKKLIQTDAQIRNLKKGVNEYTQNYEDSKFNFPDRSKRSLRGPKFRNTKREITDFQLTKENLAEVNKFNLFYPPYYANSTGKKKNKFKRFVNGTDEPTGFLIEKKQIVVQYMPHNGLKKVPKCSHAPKESKSHEKQLKHPFYKNTERLDKLLDQFLAKNLPEIMSDPFGVDVLFKKQNKDFKTHKTNVKIENEVTKKPTTTCKEDYKVFDIKSQIFGGKDKVYGAKDTTFEAKDKTFGGKDNLFEDKDKSGEKKTFFDGKGTFFDHPTGHRVGELDREFFDMVSSKKKGMTSSSSVSPSYDVILSVSTIVNPGQRKVSKPMNIIGRTPSLLERVPHIRKLMQVEEEDEEGLGYEDLKEVLADDTEGHDETDKGQDRKKRMDDYKIDDFKMPNNPYKYNPPGVHNPNWKGPMPLYPDELSSMIKQAAIQNVQNYKILPANTKDMSSETDALEKDLNDMEYIENYSDSKFEKLAKMAQAYSDYGVLEGKKESSRNDKAMESKNTERRVKLSINKGKALKNALLNRFKKSRVSEGIRFEIRPTTQSREDSPVEIMKALEKHVKVSNQKYYPSNHPTTFPLNTDYALFSSVQKQHTQAVELPTKKPDQPNEYPDNAVIFTFAKNGRRSLKSVEDPEDTEKVANSQEARLVKSVKDLEGTEKVDTKRQVTKLIIKGISGLDKFGNKTNENNTKSQTRDDNQYYHHEHYHHHTFHHHHHNISNTNKTDDKKACFGVHVLIVNETDNIRNKKGNTTTENARNDTTDAVGNLVQDNNLLSAILNLNAPKNSSEVALSDFFMLMSNWFSVMAGFDNTSEKNKPDSNIIKLTTKDTTPKSNDSIHIEFPMYDSDMIENIGHRSRVLLSMEERTDKSTEDITSIMNVNVANVTSMSSAIYTNKEGITFTTTDPTTETVKNNIQPSNEEKKELSLTDTEESLDNKTLFKRHVPEDSNLIFWNDIYDDEYGVKMDPADEAISDKSYSKGMNFVKKSGNWIQDKMRSFKINFRGKDKIDLNHRTENKRALLRANDGEEPSNIYKRFNKRATKYDEGEADDKTGGFAELTAKMKDVCKEAAKAVQQTRNVKVRQDEKEDTMTTSLMQQLVRLMTDLVDFQVQQKTCVKLPPDLEEFLVWLTSPNSEQMEFREHKMSYHGGNDFERPPEQILDLVTTQSSEREEVHADSRSECLGTLHAVQDLMQQYDEMTDEDKSKMTGIRDYLENQLQFLHKHLATFDDYKISNMFEDQHPSYRFRRQLPSKRYHKHNNQIRNKSRRYRYKRRFLKNFGKKHTRTTASIYDGFPMTEGNKLTVNKETNENFDNREAKNFKRNLKDVYYKALNDAKKSTTFKATSKDDMEGFDHAQIVRIDN